MQRFATVYSQQDFEMEEILQKLKPLKPAQVVKSLELTRSEGETGIHGIEKEIALINISVTPKRAETTITNERS